MILLGLIQKIYQKDHVDFQKLHYYLPFIYCLLPLLSSSVYLISMWKDHGTWRTNIHVANLQVVGMNFDDDVIWSLFHYFHLTKIHNSWITPLLN